LPSTKDTPPEADKGSRECIAVAPRIEKAWGILFPQAVTEKQQAKDQDAKSGHQKKEEKAPDPEERKADKKDVEKAVSDLAGTAHFAQTGMSAQIVETVNGLVVKVIQNNGQVVKIISAEEFLKLRDAATASGPARGKILDQRF
jgi:uncharacterized FlaG/YvyC family protein